MKQDKYTDSFQVSIRTIARSKSGAILAYAGVTIFGAFAIRGVKIIKGKNGPFVAMPAIRTQKGWKDICYPCSSEFRSAFDAAVLNAYDREMAQMQERVTKSLSSKQMGM